MMLAFMAALGGVTVQLAATYNVSDAVVSPTNANARFTLTSGGDITQTINSGTTDLGDWVTPKGAAGAAYEARSTITSGTLTSDPSAGSWIALSSDRQWGKTQTTVGNNTCIFTLEIRRASDLVVLATSTVTINAEKDP